MQDITKEVTCQSYSQQYDVQHALNVAEENYISKLSEDKLIDYIKDNVSTFTVDRQPYGSVTIAVNHDETSIHQTKDGTTRVDLKGTVSEGTETSRFFHHSSTKDLKGKRDYISNINLWELVKQYKVTVAC